MGKASLPPQWQLRWTGERGGDGLAVALSGLAVEAASVSMAFWEHGLVAFGRDDRDALGAIEVRLPEVPVLDEVWCLYMLAARERGEQRRRGWEAMSHYVEDVRRGFWPDRVAPEHAVQAVFSAIVHEYLAGANPNRDEFLAEALELCHHLDSRLEAGADLLASDVTNAPKLQRYRAALASDHKLYDEDVARGTRWHARIPAARANGRERRVGMLVLRSPLARQFKLWARTDPRAPGGQGYPLLLVDLGAGEIVLSADPTARLEVGWLAEGLDKLEGGEERWYDGARHAHTLVAAPKSGTRLPFDKVLPYLRRELALRRVWNRKVVTGAGIGVGLAATLGTLVMLVRPGEARDSGPAIAEANRDALYLVLLPDGQTCTAFAIAAHELATAGHCVMPASAGEAVVVRNGAGSDRHPVSRGYVHKDLDVGVLVVHDPLPAHVQLGSRADLFGAQGAKIYVYGFPGEVSNPKHPEAHIDGTTVSGRPTEARLEHTGSTSGGSSGSPIFNAAGRVIAIHSGVMSDAYGQATRFAGAVPVHKLAELRTNRALQVEPQ